MVKHSITFQIDPNNPLTSRDTTFCCPPTPLPHSVEPWLLRLSLQYLDLLMMVMLGMLIEVSIFMRMINRGTWESSRETRATLPLRTKLWVQRLHLWTFVRVVPCALYTDGLVSTLYTTSSFIGFCSKSLFAKFYALFMSLYHFLFKVTIDLLSNTMYGIPTAPMWEFSWFTKRFLLDHTQPGHTFLEWHHRHQYHCHQQHLQCQHCRADENRVQSICETKALVAMLVFRSQYFKGLNKCAIRVFFSAFNRKIMPRFVTALAQCFDLETSRKCF